MKNIIPSISVLILNIAILFPLYLQAQIGGDTTYEFLNLSPSARTTAFGGGQIAIKDDDVSLAALNPALYNPSMDSHLSLNTVAYLAGINYGYVAFAKNFDSIATFGVGIQYITYGSFTATNELGEVLGTFSGSEYAITIGGARQWQRFSYGANLKLITSHLEAYRSLGVATDIGGSYYHPEQELGIAVTIQNIGLQLTNYNNIREDLPLDIQLGFTKKLKYLPFRLSILAHHLHQWDISYENPALATTGSVFGENNAGNNVSFLDNAFRHLVFSGEFYLGKALRLRFGYNHLRRKELTVTARNGLVGFSFGAGIHIKRFQVNYGLANYHLAGSAHHFSISTKLNDWKKQ